MATNIYRVHGAPDSTTFGNVGDMYIDLDTNSLYQCVGVNVLGRDCGYITIYLGEGRNTEYEWAKVGGGGGSKTLDDFIEGTISEISSDAEMIYWSIFSGCESLTSANFPVCTNIYESAFCDCTGLTSVDFPACTSIGGYAFENCIGLASVNFTACTSIGENAFFHCDSLTTVDFPACTSIGTMAFAECIRLTSVNFPACTSIGESAFVNIGGSLTSVNFPACVSIGNNAFGTCAGLTSVNFPACTSVGETAFGDCTNLHTVDFSETVHIGPYAFAGCTNLKSVILRASSVCTMDADAFSNYGAELSLIVYVPSSMLSAYSKADGWSTLYNLGRIKAIESMT